MALGPLKVVCDAPAYEIVKASAQVGIYRPLDVRWRRIDKEMKSRCGCRLYCPGDKNMPRLIRYAFTLSSGRMIYYSMLQCGRCATVHWQPG